MNIRKALRGQVAVSKFKAKEVKEFLDRATKVRIPASDMAKRIKFGTMGTKGLVANSKYNALSKAGQIKAFEIVDEECHRQTEWAPKQLVKLAKTIEKRLAKECV